MTMVLWSQQPLPEDGSPEPKHVGAFNELVFSSFNTFSVLIF